jgi:hypothetical protein
MAHGRRRAADGLGSDVGVRSSGSTTTARMTLNAYHYDNTASGILPTIARASALPRRVQSYKSAAMCMRRTYFHNSGRTLKDNIANVKMGLE